jgi:hypothetical protein
MPATGIASAATFPSTSCASFNAATETPVRPRTPNIAEAAQRTSLKPLIDIAETKSRVIRGLRFMSETFFIRSDARAIDLSHQCHTQRACTRNGMFIAKRLSRMGLRRDRRILGHAASQPVHERRNGARKGQPVSRLMYAANFRPTRGWTEQTGQKQKAA